MITSPTLMYGQVPARCFPCASSSSSALAEPCRLASNKGRGLLTAQQGNGSGQHRSFDTHRTVAFAAAASLTLSGLIPRRVRRQWRWQAYLKAPGQAASASHFRVRAKLRAKKDDESEVEPLEYQLQSFGPPPDIDFIIKEIPARSSSSLIIQHRLGSESQYQAVLKLVEQYLPKFDIYNMATAMHRCGLAARDDDLIARQIQSDPNFVRLFDASKKEALANMREMSPATLGTFLWACSRLNVFDSELTSAIAADATQRMHFYSPQAISLLMFSLGYSGVRPRPTFIQALVTELQGRNDFGSRDLTLVVYGCMRLGIRDRRIMEFASDYIQTTMLEDSEPLTVASLCYAYAKLEYWDKRVMAVLGSRVVETMGEFTPQMFSMSALCFAAGAAYMDDNHSCMDKMKNAIEQRFSEFSHRDLSTIAFAFGKFSRLSKDRQAAIEGLDRAVDAFGFYASLGNRQETVEDPFVEAIKEETKRRDMESFTMQELNLICYALMRMENKDPEFFEAAAEVFQKNAAELMDIEINNVLYCFGRTRFLHIGLVKAMVGEVQRRKIMDELDPLQAATFAYSLAINQIRQEDLMDKIALQLCENVRDFAPRSITMVLWSMAFLNCRNHAEPLVSAVMEDMSTNPKKYTGNIEWAINFWACSILAGPAAALWTMKMMFQHGFWDRNFNVKEYTMLHFTFASLHAELGLPVEELTGHYICRRLYEESTISFMGEQHRRLSERLRIQQIPHLCNAMAPKLEGFREAGVRVDIAIIKLTLIIEVEGPARNTIPLDKLSEKLDEDDQYLEPGEPADVLSSAREFVECGLTGSAAFKRRLLRKCGWRVVTVSFDESEEYIADALKKMINKEDSETQEQVAAMDAEAQSALLTSSERTEIPDLESLGLSRPDQSDITQFEFNLREKHADALKNLRLRVAKERGDAAWAGRFSNHLEFRKWQVGLEKSILKDMVDEVTKVAA
eukprot:TRINITY_DN22918_c0_g1_i1.p1 TRINITY_DN22918_c0_g1~~TRINITY_DN22918_c0_g1_i1.p1  ORF type:complete len:963 (-),score=177.56 TRINITY_DN22918_c0_g1_i1:103-2991(-)